MANKKIDAGAEERADFKTRFSSEHQPEKNGRPRESRDRLSQSFMKALADDFETNGVAAIEKVRTDDPSTYLRVVASLQPKEVELNHPLNGLSDGQLAQAIELLADLLREQAPASRRDPAPSKKIVN